MTFFSDNQFEFSVLRLNQAFAPMPCNSPRSIAR